MATIPTLVPARVFVLQIASGVAVRCAGLENQPTHVFAWEQGNFSCGCNRAIFWAEGAGLPEGFADDAPCTEGLYTIALIAGDGSVLWSDMPEGWAPPQ